MSKNILPYEYVQFLQEKIREHLPSTFHLINGKYNGRCPFCGDSQKSSTKKRGWIYFSNDCSYYCFNCGIGMSGIKFLEAISGESYKDIRKEYAKMLFKNNFNSSLSSVYHQPSDEPTIYEMKSIINPEWKNKLTDKALQYLKDRKVLEAPYFNNNLYSCFNKKNQDEYILISWLINGIDSYYQLNDFQKLHNIKYIFPKNKKKTVYGLDNIDISWPYIIVFEGFYDSLFVKNGVCVGTKAITDYQISLIKERYPYHQIVISFDNDEAGLNSMMKLVKKQTNFKFFKWFNQNTKEKDINDYVLSKNNVNIFTDSNILERLIVDKLLMKMFLIQIGMWKSSEKKIYKAQNDTSSFWKKRKI